VRTSSNNPPIALGRPATMPAKIRIEMPLPRPALGDLLTQPHQEHRAGHQADHRRHAEAEARRQHQARRAFQRQRDAQRLEQRQQQRAVARVLRDLAAAGLAFLLQRLERRHHVGHQLHDDRRRDVRHDAQREHREARQRAAAEHVEQVQDAALLPLEQLLQLRRVDAGHGDVRPDAVDDQRHHRKMIRRRRSPNFPLLASCWADVATREVPSVLQPIRRSSRQPLRWQPWHRPWRRCP
jgi:hypothetical protein